jgi:hypothetical protein
LGAADFEGLAEKRFAVLKVAGDVVEIAEAAQAAGGLFGIGGGSDG